MNMHLNVILGKGSYLFMKCVRVFFWIITIYKKREMSAFYWLVDMQNTYERRTIWSWGGFRFWVELWPGPVPEVLGQRSFKNFCLIWVKMTEFHAWFCELNIILWFPLCPNSSHVPIGNGCFSKGKSEGSRTRTGATLQPPWRSHCLQNYCRQC